MTSPDEQLRKQAQEVDKPADVDSGAEELVVQAAEDDPMSMLQSELADAMQEVEKLRDVTLRAEAEIQNVRRRATRDVESAHKFGLEKFIANLLPVADSLEKAIEAVNEAQGVEDVAAKAIIEGVGLCQRMLLDVMAKEGVAVVNPEGEPFDPNLHQAMAVIDAPLAEPGSVVTVVQKGYTLNERLVRPAMVLVARTPE